MDPLELKELPAPIGDFIIEHATGVMGADGMYYHFAEVCKLLRLYAQKLKAEGNPIA
jgi:hypothetical protein